MDTYFNGLIKNTVEDAIINLTIVKLTFPVRLHARRFIGNEVSDYTTNLQNAIGDFFVAQCRQSTLNPTVF